MAEIESYHAQKVEDFASLAKEHLDGEIEFYEQVSILFLQACPTFRDQLVFTPRPCPACPVFFSCLFVKKKTKKNKCNAADGVCSALLAS
jgi:hypothetical protein